MHLPRARSQSCVTLRVTFRPAAAAGMHRSSGRQLSSMLGLGSRASSKLQRVAVGRGRGEATRGVRCALRARVGWRSCWRRGMRFSSLPTGSTTLSLWTCPSRWATATSISGLDNCSNEFMMNRTIDLNYCRGGNNEFHKVVIVTRGSARRWIERRVPTLVGHVAVNLDTCTHGHVHMCARKCRHRH